MSVRAGPVAEPLLARLSGPAPVAARALLGLLLVREDDAGRRVARIVETEAYDQQDPASHSAVGCTRRTAPMFSRAGTAYVYRSYGVHWCLNVAAGPEGRGAAVLVRAAEVLEGADLVRERRPAARRDHELLRGPGRLTAGLDVDGPRHTGGDLLAGVAGLALADDGWRPGARGTGRGPRVGVRRAPDVAWRFWLHGRRAVSPYRRHPKAPPAAHSARN